MPRIAGRIGKRVKLPRGRATVKRLRSLSQETCPNTLQPLDTRGRCSGSPGFDIFVPLKPVPYRNRESVGFRVSKTKTSNVGAQQLRDFTYRVAAELYVA